jgi:hypothetical protein
MGMHGHVVSRRRTLPSPVTHHGLARSYPRRRTCHPPADTRRAPAPRQPRPIKRGPVTTWSSSPIHSRDRDQSRYAQAERSKNSASTTASSPSIDLALFPRQWEAEHDGRPGSGGGRPSWRPRATGAGGDEPGGDRQVPRGGGAALR